LDRRLSLGLLGLIAGLASGLLGVGGGIVMVPPLVALLGMTQHQAHATSLAAIVPIATVGAATFAAGGEVDIGIAGALVAGTLIGAPLGARIMAGVSETMLRLVFGIFLVIIAVELLVG
jgi:uncharacterized membrane protein YfcA